MVYKKEEAEEEEEEAFFIDKRAKRMRGTKSRLASTLYYVEIQYCVCAR